jgi:prepilin-type N-terminal cleavage/methylation domain-containing protein
MMSTRNLYPSRAASGFTLVEIAVVVAIVGMLLTAGIRLALTQIENAAISGTKKKQDTIKQALITYLGKNKRLPCPDTATGNGPGPLGFTVAAPPDGRENRVVAGDVTSACVAAYGVLPYADLNLPREVALDGWDNYFSYQLTVGPDPGTPTAAGWHVTANFADTNIGAIQIFDRPPPDPPGTAVETTSPLSRAVAVVVSYGSNGSGAFNVVGTQNAAPALVDPLAIDEATNALGFATAPPVTYFSRLPNNNKASTGGAFDDVVMYVTADDLISPLRRDSTLRSSTGIVNDQLASLRNAAIGYVLKSEPAGTCLLPNNVNLLLPPNQLNDPWNHPYAVLPLTNTGAANWSATANVIPAPPADGFTALLLYSFGPNGTDDAGVGDDIAVRISLAELNAILSQSFGNYQLKCP